MSVFSGAGGAVEFTSNGTQDVAITRWTADFQRDIFDASVFSEEAGVNSETNAKEKIGGMHKAVGTIEGFVDAAVIPDIAEFQDAAASVGVSKTGHIELVEIGGTDGTIGYEFDCILSNIVIGMEKTGMSRFSANFESTGAIAEVVTH